jgi:hypothetical protein
LYNGLEGMYPLSSRCTKNPLPRQERTSRSSPLYLRIQRMPYPILMSLDSICGYLRIQISLSREAFRHGLKENCSMAVLSLCGRMLSSSFWPKAPILSLETSNYAIRAILRSKGGRIVRDYRRDDAFDGLVFARRSTCSRVDFVGLESIRDVPCGPPSASP